MAALTGGPSLNVPGNAGEIAKIVGYAYMGISAEEVTITCPGDADFPTAGVSFPCSSNAAAASQCNPVRWLRNAIPIACGEAIVATGTSGANDAWGLLYLDVPPYNFKKPTDDQAIDVFKWTRGTAASGTNLTALTVQTGLVTLTQWGNRPYELDAVTISGAFTTAPIIGLKIDKADWPYWLYLPLPETDVANLWPPTQLPPGMFKVKAGETLLFAWLSDTAEQPTANVTVKYPAVKGGR